MIYSLHSKGHGNWRSLSVSSSKTWLSGSSLQWIFCSIVILFIRKGSFARRPSRTQFLMYWKSSQWDFKKCFWVVWSRPRWLVPDWSHFHSEAWAHRAADRWCIFPRLWGRPRCLQFWTKMRWWWPLQHTCRCWTFRIALSPQLQSWSWSEKRSLACSCHFRK